jgi:hypothetical protein
MTATLATQLTLACLQTALQLGRENRQATSAALDSAFAQVTGTVGRRVSS